jgi:copper chaperone CopZ
MISIAIAISNAKKREFKSNNKLTIKLEIMKKLILATVFILGGFSIQAQEKLNKNAKYEIEVNGNCDMCQGRIQKAAFSVSGVKSANWSVETHQLNLILNEEKTNLLEVKKAIAKAGYDTDEVKATIENYDKLPVCCQYDRK